MLHIPILRKGKPYKSIDLLRVPHHRTRQPFLEMSQANTGLIRRDLLDQASLDGLAARVDPGLTLREAKARFERDCISAMLLRHHGRVGEAAKALGIQRTNLYRKVRQLNVSRTLLSSRK